MKKRTEYKFGKFRMTTKTFSRTDSGKSWRKHPDEVESKLITSQEHYNITNEHTQQTFRRMGGSETETRSYTRRGYIVTELISCSPDRSIRKVRTFDTSR